MSSNLICGLSDLYEITILIYFQKKFSVWVIMTTILLWHILNVPSGYQIINLDILGSVSGDLAQQGWLLAGEKPIQQGTEIYWASEVPSMWSTKHVY